MRPAADILIAKLREHSTLSDRAMDALRGITIDPRALAPKQDFVRQGDKPTVAALVISGVVMRYHTLPTGKRQYLSMHIPGDLPDAQSLFIDTMDHSVCAAGEASVGLIPHEEITDMFKRLPEVGFALWRETLIDAAIFRQAITNNSARMPIPRLAHFICEIYYRMRAGKHAEPGQCYLPISQHQIGDTLGISVVTANRALQALRMSKAVDWRDGRVMVFDWEKLAAIAEFDPSYLHLRRPRRL